MTREEILEIAKPILFNTEMVRAILDGRKTVTRRCVKYKYSNTEMKMHTDKYGTRLIEIQKDVEGETFGKNPDGSTWHKLLGYIEPTPPYKYKPGDILYVRETWQLAGLLDDNEQLIDGTEKYYYAAGPEIPYFDYWIDEKTGEHKERMPWRPSIHMPKEAARIFLKVTDVRVERLQEITEEQAVKEGIYQSNCKNCNAPFGCDACPDEGYDEVYLFSELWNSTIKKSVLDIYGWEANPWVWCISFERIEV